jgi:photosynthetic reaction center cytochrome c subunit
MSEASKTEGLPGLKTTLGILGFCAAVLLGIAMITSFERPPLQTVQRGYRGTAMVENYNPRLMKAIAAANVVPASLPPLPAVGPKASAVYKNVKVLGDLSVGQFTRLMVSITNWVAPTQGCAYCHNTNNMAEDSVYTKVVARRMIQMTQGINSGWTDHVAETGVTCYTCHRGNPVPSNIYFTDPGPKHPGGAAEAHTGKNLAAPAINNSSLPYDPFTPYLVKDENIRVQAERALPGTDSQGIKETDWTYALMIHFSQSLGVNCTYCHNTRAFGDWSQGTPQRVTAWHGIRMVRDINNTYLASLQGVFPPVRLGAAGDVAKVACATCHQGVNKPLNGVSMVKDFPELRVAPAKP